MLSGVVTVMYLHSKISDLLVFDRRNLLAGKSNVNKGRTFPLHQLIALAVHCIEIHHG